jgi:ABC-type branched-subunit amino acid transport system ATPase component
VDDVSFSVHPGEIVGLIGPNGAGKTSLIDTITGFYPQSGGSILLNGQDIGAWSAVQRSRAGICRSFQSLELFEDMTVVENIRAASDSRGSAIYFKDLVYPAYPPLSAELVAAIGEFGLADDFERQVEDLPYGKRRLLAVARAVATKPSILLLDECAAGLSDGESQELAVVVRRLADSLGMGIILIEHDVSFVMSLCDRVVVLDFGRIISEGVPSVVRNDEKVVAAYLGGTREGLKERLGTG